MTINRAYIRWYLCWLKVCESDRKKQNDYDDYLLYYFFYCWDIISYYLYACYDRSLYYLYAISDYHREIIYIRLKINILLLL